MFENYEDVLTVEEACEALRIGRNTLYRLLHGNKLKGYRCGRIWKIPRGALREYVLENAKIKP